MQMKVALKGFMYVRDKTQNGATQWRCEDYLEGQTHVDASTAKDDSFMRRYLNTAILETTTFEHLHTACNFKNLYLCTTSKRMW